jgi:membrane protease YdiL (CAAX protease family)
MRNREDAIRNTRREPKIDMGGQIVLHLLPGVLTGVAYAGLGTLFLRNGLPAILGFYAATLLVLVPFEIGVPLLLERRGERRATLSDIFLFRDPVPTWQMVVLIVGSLLWAGLVFAVAGSSLVDPIREALFSWFPERYDLAYYALSDAYARPVRIVTWGLGIVFTVFLGPIVEELYFRSYLLPRMSQLKALAPLVGAVLFALYHVWSPWQVLVRVIAILPMVYAVWWKKNVWIGVGAHCLLNLVGDTLSAIPLVFG